MRSAKIPPPKVIKEAVHDATKQAVATACAKFSTMCAECANEAELLADLACDTCDFINIFTDVLINIAKIDKFKLEVSSGEDILAFREAAMKSIIKIKEFYPVFNIACERAFKVKQAAHKLESKTYRVWLTANGRSD
jgi:hypothetical protein